MAAMNYGASLPPPRTTSSSISLPSSSSVTPTGGGAAASLSSSTYLKAKFRVGSVHGRRDYDDAERVFHPTDVPLHAREAKTHVQQQVLATNLLVKNKPKWDITSTAGPNKSRHKRAPWDDDGFDDRHFHKVETDYLVTRARERIDHIRSGGASAEEAAALHDRWNVSTFVEAPKTQLLNYQSSEAKVEAKERTINGATTQTRTLPSVVKPRTPVGHKTLIERHRDHHDEQRHQKLTDRAASEDASRRHAEHVDNVTLGLAGISVSSRGQKSSSSLWHTAPEDFANAGLRSNKNGARAIDHVVVTPDQYSDEAFQAYVSQLRQHGAPTTIASSSLAAAAISSMDTNNGTSSRPSTSGGAIRRWEHRGVWAMNAMEGHNMWSCCLADSHDARGCTAIHQRDSQRWVYDHPTQV